MPAGWRTVHRGNRPSLAEAACGESSIGGTAPTCLPMQVQLGRAAGFTTLLTRSYDPVREELDPEKVVHMVGRWIMFCHRSIPEVFLILDLYPKGLVNTLCFMFDVACHP